MKVIYLVGSLRNPKVPELAAALRAEGYDVFDDWFAAGFEADLWWQRYEKARGKTYSEALDGYPAWHVFNYDKTHLDRCDATVLLMPAGKSGHMEFGYVIGQGKPGFILLPEEPGADASWDVMYRFATRVVYDVPTLVMELKRAIG